MTTKTAVEVLEDLGVAFEDFKTRNDRRIGELEAEINARSVQAGGRDPSQLHIPREFSDQLRQLAKEGRGAIEISRPQGAVTIGSATGGGNTSAEVLDGIDLIARRTSPVMDLCRNVNSATSNLGWIVAGDDAAGGWVDEGDSRTETGTSTFHKVTPTFGFVYARPKISEEALDDSDFNLGQWLTEEAGRIIGQKIGAAIISGDGSAKPTGFLNGTPSSTTDTGSPARTFGTLQYVASGKAGAFQNDRLGSPAGDPAGCLFDALYALNPVYRANSTWLMNSLTLRSVRKFRDGDGNYIFTPGLVSGSDGMLLGRPVVTAEDMPDVGSNSLSIAVGDFNMGYLLVKIGNIRITVDDNITTPGQILFYVRARVGGKLINDDAIKVVRFAAS